MKKYKLVRIAASLLALLLTHVQSFGVPPETERVVRALTQTTDIRDFNKIATLLSTEAQVTIIAEGSPLKEMLTADDISNLSDQIQQTRKSLPKIIEAVAEQFDYTVVESSPKTFLFLKKFTNPQDLPDVTPAEAAVFIKNLRQAVGVFDPQGNPASLLKTALKTATKEERKQLSSGLRFSDLHEELQNVIRRISMSGCIPSGFGNLLFLNARLNGCLSPNTVFLWKSIFGVTFPGYVGPIGTNGEKEDIFLSYYIRASSSGGLFLNAPAGFEPVNGALPKNFKDPSEPSLNKTFPSNTGSYVKIIAQCIAGISQDGKPGGIVDKSIATKRLSIFNSTRASREDIVQGIAQIYGLRVIRMDAKTYRLTTPTAHIVRTGKEFTAEVQRLIPASFSRAAGISHPQTENRDELLYLASVSRLRQIIEPLLKQNAPKALPFAKAPEEARNLVTLTTLSLAIHDFQQLAKPLPKFLDDIENTKVELFMEDNMGNCRVTLEGKGQPSGVEVMLPIPPDIPNP